MQTKSLANKLNFKLNIVHFKVLGQGDPMSVDDDAKKNPLESLNGTLLLRHETFLRNVGKETAPVNREKDREKGCAKNKIQVLK